MEIREKGQGEGHQKISVSVLFISEMFSLTITIERKFSEDIMRNFAVQFGKRSESTDYLISDIIFLLTALKSIRRFAPQSREAC